MPAGGFETARAGRYFNPLTVRYISKTKKKHFVLTIPQYNGITDTVITFYDLKRHNYGTGKRKRTPFVNRSAG